MPGSGELQLDTSKWSGEGVFTAQLIEHLRRLDTIAFLRVEDAPASRSEADYNFISNEVFVGFATREREERVLVRLGGPDPVDAESLERARGRRHLGQRARMDHLVGQPRRQRRAAAGV